ncbi:MAG: hypothetical protein QOK37_2910 [Thermoanaerobaculia bacterium]|nr:hypothetical protein [Thermoanaerobaculia bacterium]
MNSVVVTVTNRAGVDVFVSGDPNWDDQQLMVDGQVISSPYALSTGGTITVSVNWDAPAAEEMMGVIFAQTKVGNDDFYQLAVGQDPNTGNLAITSEYSFGTLAFRYSLSNQAPWSMTMTFENVS